VKLSPVVETQTSLGDGSACARAGNASAKAAASKESTRNMLTDHRARFETIALMRSLSCQNTRLRHDAVLEASLTSLGSFAFRNQHYPALPAYMKKR